MNFFDVINKYGIHVVCISICIYQKYKVNRWPNAAFNPLPILAVQMSHRTPCNSRADHGLALGMSRVFYDRMLQGRLT